MQTRVPILRSPGGGSCTTSLSRVLKPPTRNFVPLRETQPPDGRSATEKSLTIPQGVARIAPGSIKPGEAVSTARSVSWFAAVSEEMTVAIRHTQPPGRTSLAIRCVYGAPKPIAVGRNVTLPILSSPAATVEGARYEPNVPHHRIAPG